MISSASRGKRECSVNACLSVAFDNIRLVANRKPSGQGVDQERKDLRVPIRVDATHLCEAMRAHSSVNNRWRSIPVELICPREWFQVLTLHEALSILDAALREVSSLVVNVGALVIACNAQVMTETD